MQFPCGGDSGAIERWPGTAAPPPSPARRGGVAALRLFGGELCHFWFLDRHAPVDAILVGRVIAGGAMIGAAIVPDHDVADAPFVAVLAVRLNYVAGEFVDQIIAFLG